MKPYNTTPLVQLGVLALMLVVATPQMVLAGTFDERMQPHAQATLPRVDELRERGDELRARAAAAFARADRFREGEVLVRYVDEDAPRLKALRPGERVRDAVAVLRARDDVLYAEPNYLVHALYVPNDTYYQPYQWHMDNASGSGVNAEEAWDITRGRGATVAIIDTGVAYETARRGWTRYYQAPDLAGTCFVQGYDFAYNDPYPNDDQGHGTHVAGTIAQTTDNGEGVAGLAHEACIMPIKALDRYGGGTHADIAAAIQWAADNGADVINLSLGGPDSSHTLEDAVRYAYEKGVTVVAAAGNNGAEQAFYPAAYDEYVIAVGATGYDTEFASYSNYGDFVDMVAPGGDSEDLNGDGAVDGILQQTIGGRLNEFGYYFSMGTSMAAPHVAAAAALLVSAGVATTPDAVRVSLATTARDLGTPGVDMRYGHGLVDVAAALMGDEVSPEPEPQPEPEPEEPVVEDAAPHVTLRAPAVDAVLRDVVMIAADATDDIGIASVSLRVVGTGFVVELTDEPYSASWDTRTVPDGSYTLTVTARDTTGQEATDEHAVTVDNVNELPIANAGDDVRAVAGSNGTASVSLSGYQSYDPDGELVAYDWHDGSGERVASIRDITQSVGVGTHLFTLTVEDDRGATSSDTVQVTVEAMPETRVVFTDSFEAGMWNGQWSQGTAGDWTISTKEHTDGSYSAEVDGRANNAALTSRTISLDGSAATVYFDWYIDRGLDRGERLAFLVSKDGGISWQLLRTLDGNVAPEDVWHSESVSITGTDSLVLRFEGTMSMSSEDAYVDNVRVERQ